jgi:hypothetical protein
MVKSMWWCAKIPIAGMVLKMTGCPPIHPWETTPQRVPKISWNPGTVSFFSSPKKSSTPIMENSHCLKMTCLNYISYPIYPIYPNFCSVETMKISPLEAQNVPRLPWLSTASWWLWHLGCQLLGYWPSIEAKSDDRPDEVAGLTKVSIWRWKSPSKMELFMEKS